MVWSHVPDSCLREKGDCSGCAAIVGQEGCHGDDNKDEMLPCPRPIERIVRVIARLGKQDRLTIRGPFELAVRVVSDNVTFTFIELVKVGYILNDGLGGLLDVVHGGKSAKERASPSERICNGCREA